MWNEVINMLSGGYTSERLYEEIAFLVYRTGVSYADAMSMPVANRIVLLRKIVSFIEKEIEAIEKAKRV